MGVMKRQLHILHFIELISLSHVFIDQPYVLVFCSIFYLQFYFTHYLWFYFTHYLWFYFTHYLWFCFFFADLSVVRLTWKGRRLSPCGTFLARNHVFLMAVHKLKVSLIYIVSNLHNYLDLIH